MTDWLDVVCIGEALVDFLPEHAGKRVADVERWTRCSGGSPANVAVGVARLGGKSALVGCVGRDEFGDYLKATLGSEGVDTSHLRQTEEGKTGLVFVSLTETGERSFSFHRTRAAELFLSARDVDAAFISSTRAVHCGTNSLLWTGAQKAMLAMVHSAHEAGRIICCDPNLRLHLWADPADLKGVLARLLPSCTVVKLSEEEIEFVTGTKDVERALAALRKLGVALPVVTRAEKGATFLCQDKVLSVAAPAANVVDTTGAGDGFTAGFLWGLTRLYPDAAAVKAASIGEIRELATFASVVGSRVVEKMGAVTALPTIAEVSALVPRLLKTTAG